ncbi:MAG: hypothetical protein ACTHKH_02260 [Trinickia sp.]|jgi:hypothetical protein
MTVKAERRIFFSIAATVCRVLLLGAIVSMLFVGISIATQSAVAGHVDDIVPVSVDTVLASIPGKQSDNDGFSSSQAASIDVPNAAGIRIPKPLNAVLTSDTASQPILNAWLDNVPMGYRRQFVAGLAKVVTSANQHAVSWEWDNRQRYVATAMGEYARITIDRLSELADERKRAADKLADYRSAMGTLMGIAATLTLLLTVMAIERNTRPRA